MQRNRFVQFRNSCFSVLCQYLWIHVRSPLKRLVLPTHFTMTIISGRKFLGTSRTKFKGDAGKNSSCGSYALYFYPQGENFVLMAPVLINGLFNFRYSSLQRFYFIA